MCSDIRTQEEISMHYEKLYAFLVGQIDNTLSMIELERGEMPDALLLRRVEVVLQTALSDAEERYLSGTDEGIDYRGLYESLKVGVRIAAKQQLMSILRGDITREAMYANYEETVAILKETDREFSEELKK